MDKKNIKLTFYVVCGLLLGAPYIWKLIQLVPDILETIPNAADILAAAGYAILVIASIAVAFKLGESIEVLKAYNLGITKGISENEFAPNELITREQMATMMTRALGSADLFEILFEIACAPFYGVESPLVITILMLVLAITSYGFLNRMPVKHIDNTNNNGNQ